MSEKSKRGLGFGGSAILLGAICWSVVMACSEGEERPGFTANDAAAEAARPSALDGSFGETDAGGCPPAAPTRPIVAAPTKRFQPGACTPTQLDGYVKDCLQSNGNVCNLYKGSNASCAACIESTSSDMSWSALVYYGNREYFDYNYGGCIANVTADFSATGCGAAQTRYLECRRAACAGCIPTGFPRDFEPFYKCQNTKAADNLCATELTDVRVACESYFDSKPMDTCQGAGLPPDDYVKRLITGWCGGDPPDGGDDAGDGG